MKDIAIRAEGLSKAYRIGMNEQRHETLAGSVSSVLKAPLRNFRNLRRLSRFSGEDEEDLIWALRDVSFEIQRGEVVGFIGRNGAGKSTLLKILSRVTEPTKGRAEVFGRVGSLLEVGTGFHPDLTGRENIYLNGTILGMRKREIDAKFDDILDFSGVAKFIDTPVKRYSSGMRVRLGFAVAAHLEPELLVVDEVLAVGDAEFQNRCIGKMKDVAGSGRTVLFVSHNMGSIVDLCTRCVVLERGQMVLDDKPDAAVQHYLTFNQQEGEVLLADWHGERSGGGPMKVKRVATLGEDGQVATTFVNGKPIRWLVEFEGKSSAGVILGVSVRDKLGRLVLHLGNVDDDTVLRTERSAGRLEVTLPRNPLSSGVYYVTVWLGDEMNRLHDRVGNCLSFHVDNSILGRKVCGAPVLFAAEWRLLDEQP